MGWENIKVGFYIMVNGLMIQGTAGGYCKIEKWDINILEIGNKIGNMGLVGNSL